MVGIYSLINVKAGLSSLWLPTPTNLIKILKWGKNIRLRIPEVLSRIISARVIASANFYIALGPALKRVYLIERLLQHIRTYYSLGTAASEAVHDSFTQVVLAKGDFLVTEGKICRQLYFLEEGALRGYYNLEGREITHWFAFAGDFVTSFHSFITGQPAVENVRLLEGCVLWAISKEKLTALMDRFHEIERIVRIAYEHYYIRLEERFVNNQFRPAAERYRQLLEQSPHILQQAPLGHVASYLGISQETLSRIRGRL